MTGHGSRPVRRWLPLLVVPLASLVVAALIITNGDDLREHNQNHAPGDFPSPAPVTFIAPTPRPTATGNSLLGQPLPDITLTTLDGDRLRLRDLQGRLIVLNFWATWCEPCRAEMPTLQALQNERGADDLRVIAVTDPTSGQTEADIRAFVDTYDLSLTVALSSDLEFFQQFGVLQIPTTYLIDRAGTIRERHTGPLTAEDLAAHLAEVEG